MEQHEARRVTFKNNRSVTCNNTGIVTPAGHRAAQPGTARRAGQRQRVSVPEHGRRDRHKHMVGVSTAHPQGHRAARRTPSVSP